MTDLDKPVTRRTRFVVQNRRMVVTMHPNGIGMRPERSSKGIHMSWARLYAAMKGLPGPFTEPSQQRHAQTTADETV